MLNDIKDWAVDKGHQSKELAEGVASEVTTQGVMDWSGTVWLVLLGLAVVVAIGFFGKK